MRVANMKLTAILFLLVLPVVISSCKKDEMSSGGGASIKIITTVNEPKQVSMVSSSSGVALALITSGDVIYPPVKQEVFILNSNGGVQRRIQLSDTLFQHMSAVPGMDGGFFICASTNTLPYIAIYHLNDAGDIVWSNTFTVKSGTNLNQPIARLSRDSHYMVMYQSYGSGYYLWKGDVNGNEVFNTKLPIPNAIHYGTGLNYGERYSNFFQPNDTQIVIQGITVDRYEFDIENCFLRVVSESLVKKWYSDNYDSTHLELGAGFTYINDKIILFGTKSVNSFYEYFGDPFIRMYSTAGDYEGETLIPRVEGTPTIIKSVIPSPDGGYLLVGSNNQYIQGELVSPNKIVVIKLNHDTSISWSQAIYTGYPSRGFDAVYHGDGTIGLLGFLKERDNTNKLMYLHLDASGLIINN